MANTAPPKKEAPEPETEAEPEEIVPTSLDEQTHAELLNLIEESSGNILFAKAQQWSTVGSTLAVFLVLVGMARFVSSNPKFVQVLEITVFLATPAALFILIIYQFWQQTELAKLQTAGTHFSSLYRKIRGIKSGREANLHRYILLIFMTGVIVLGAVVTLLGLASLPK